MMAMESHREDPHPQRSHYLSSRSPSAPDNIRQHRRIEDEALRRLLLGYLVDTVPVDFPGVESMRATDILHEYPTLAESGIVPDKHELIQCHPKLKDAIEQFFALSGFD